MANAMGYKGPIQLDQALYLAEPEVIIERVQTAEDRQSIMVVGHNPGLELLIQRLTGHEQRFPTAALAQIHIDAPTWRTLGSVRSARLLELWRPRELPPPV